MADLFGYINHLVKKTPLVEPPEVFEKDFSPFIINRFMSCERGFALVANLVNRNGFTKQMVRDLYFHGLPKSNKFIKYNAKKEKAEKTLKYIMDHFGVNLQTAKDYSVLLSEKEIQEIIDFNEKRGSKK